MCFTIVVSGGLYGLHIAAYNHEKLVLECYACKWDRLLNWETIPYSYKRNSTVSLISPICSLGKGSETGFNILIREDMKV
jgi:hypothetical protein